MASFRADVDSMLEMMGPKPEIAPIEIAEDTKGEDSRARKKDRIDLEVMSRASLIDKETFQMSARELAPRASSSR